MRLAGTVLVAAACLAAVAEEPRADLALRDAAGRKVRLRDLRGKPVLFNFWATWCGPCNAEKPMLVEMEKESAGRGVVLIGASLTTPGPGETSPGFCRFTKSDFWSGTVPPRTIWRPSRWAVRFPPRLFWMSMDASCHGF